MSYHTWFIIGQSDLIWDYYKLEFILNSRMFNKKAQKLKVVYISNDELEGIHDGS